MSTCKNAAKRTGVCAGGSFITWVKLLLNMAGASSGYWHLFIAAGFLLLSVDAKAYMIVTLSTATTETTEQQLLTQIKNQFNASLFVNPFAANTYQVTLFGMNQNYQPPVTETQLLNSLTAATTANYIPGFADGMTYQQTQEENYVGSFGALCSLPTAFMLQETSSSTFNEGTCQDVISTILNALFQESSSTPTVIPPEP